jgi:hypothetical protein
MSGQARPMRLGHAEAAQLLALLTAEEGEYRRLRRLAWRQTAYLKRGDTARLARNAAEWRQYLPLADVARRGREACVKELAARLGVTGPRLTVDALTERGTQAERGPLRAAVRRLAATAGDLYRQNGLNVMLARFCLELVTQESAIFRQCVLGDAAGCYEGDGQRATAGGSCVLQHRA